MKFRHLVAFAAHRLRVPLPKLIKERVFGATNFLQAERELRNLFAKSTVVLESRGLWRVQPMPSQDSLAEYYGHTYWSARGDGMSVLRPRDVGQFQHLKEVLGESFSGSGLSAINFGSGHGGMSYLLSAAGFEVTNVDMFDAEVPGCQFATSLSSLSRSCNLFYASHSLEHLNDLPGAWQQINRVLNPQALIYVEVPNSEYEPYSHLIDGHPWPRLNPPHTYYMTIDYFRSLPYRILDLSAYRYDCNKIGERVSVAKDGEVLRYIAISPF
jgi:hypothetical protein